MTTSTSPVVVWGIPFADVRMTEPTPDDADDYTEHPITEAEPEDDPSVGHEPVVKE